ncbi:hypothetical protein TraAM80_07596 [Trypanosoma rangeli]|uniref:Methyltransferase n=1 Tax=Trypanosoma rangeli TaxID=5698 RepID=A0A422N4S9_TRYRA|nr:uncharacterized protein TraAM80_07596 [Trypanosoma rangeli]RNF00432.1 hypothetical protein TraAM80_07596 [Trypanosoma rangeli]|eukprot:RNF00432.1 hypothetical protein TraAM80_07596 [Trypanosoma rangeli]
MKEGFRHRHGLKRALHLLQERHCWLAKDAHVFFLAGEWQYDVIRWIAQQQQQQQGHQRVGQPMTPQGVQTQATRHWVQVSDELTSKRQFIEATMGAPQEDVNPTNSFYVFDGAHQGTSLRQIEEDVGGVVSFPFALTEAASYIRHQGQKQSNDKPNELLTCTKSAGNVLTNENVRESASLHELRLTFMNRQTVDLLAVDFVGRAGMGRAPAHSIMTIHTREFLVDAMALGAHLLRPSGALLLRFPLSMELHDKRFTASVRQHMRWSFQSSGCEVDNDHLYCVGCRHTTEHPITAEAKIPVPGLLNRSVFRPRRWNPRKRTDRVFFAALMPSFTGAPLVKEPLSRAIKEEVSASKKVEEKADALFRVSLGMVEGSAHHSKRDD